MIYKSTPITVNTPTPIAERIYPKSVVYSISNQINSKISKGAMFGEIAPSPSTCRLSLNNISNRVVSSIVKDGNLELEVEILDTPAGRLIRDALLIAGREKLYLAARGIGTIVREKTSGFDVVQDDFQIAAFDFCFLPNKIEG